MMLPFITRKRKYSSSSSSADHPANEMISTIQKSSCRFRRLRVKTACSVVLLVILILYVYGWFFWKWGENSLIKEEFLETDKCPACYGQSMCFQLFDNQFKLSGLSNFRAFDVMNSRNVHFAYHKEEGHEVVLKKLGHNSEIQSVDEHICLDSQRRTGCDVARRFVVSKIGREIREHGLQPEHVKDTSFMFFCPTHRMLDLVKKKYKERIRQSGTLNMDDYLQILFTSKVNSESLLLQTFPQSEGWPFPQYHGACGRYIVVENTGQRLGEFYNAPFSKRADLAYQMLQMAVKMTKDPDWALYWTDLVYENFAVDSSGKLTVIDVENIIVVDKKATKLANQKSWDELAESRFDACKKHEGMDYGNCLSFDVDQLCTHHESDHNYYSACRNMLSRFADDSYFNRPGGLLHDMPDMARDDWDLDNLLDECTKPTQRKGRLKVIYKLLDALDHLRTVPVKKGQNLGRRIP